MFIPVGPDGAQTITVSGGSTSSNRPSASPAAAKSSSNQSSDPKPVPAAVQRQPEAQSEAAPAPERKAPQQCRTGKSRAASPDADTARGRGE